MAKKTGRPYVEIDKDLFQKVLAIPFSTLENVSAFFDCSEDTIERWCKREFKVRFADLKTQKTEGMKLKLAGKQYEVAMKGSIPMLIWLGKQNLGQSEKVESKIDATVSDVTYKASWGGKFESEEKDT